MNKEKKIIKESDKQSVVEIDNRYYLVDKKDKICILPYSIDGRGLLDKVGVITDVNHLENKKVITILNDYLSSDDETDLVGANRVLFNITGVNIKTADKWMYLGYLYNNMNAESPIQIYAVNITDIEFPTNETVENVEERKKFKLLDGTEVLQSDDILFLASYLRLFNFFYCSSLNKDK